MPQNVTQYDLLISCPGDIKEEIEVINRTVQKFNDQFSDTLGISIRTRHWSKNSYPQSGGKPQALLNEQFVKKCDAAVALFWTRFGTPTDEYGSGTEEEIEIMMDAGKQVFLYFSEKPISPSKMDSEGYQKVQALKQKYNGIYFSYCTAEDFESSFYAHLTQYFLSVKAVADAKLQRKSQLVLRGIDVDGHLCETPTVLDFKFNTSKDSKIQLAEIKELYRKIDSMHMGQRLPVKKDGSEKSPWNAFAYMGDSLFPPVTVDQKLQETIVAVAKSLEIPLSDDFFHLGNLSQNITSVSLMGGCSYTGTKDEELKYELIMELHDSISEFINWSKVEEAYAGLTCIKLAIENSGTAVDEDIEVELRFNNNILLPLDKFPEIQDEYTIEYLLDKCDLKVLLSIPPTAQYKAYDDSQKIGSSIGEAPYPFNPFTGRDYQEDYQDDIADIYCYEIFAEKDRCIMKVKFDYIKHHTVIAFPTPIFLQKAPTEIEYTITSKNSPDILLGKLLVTTNTIDAQ
ncbi:hypothetical protein H6B33_06135 [Gemmiger formicilis]|uniref:hypothetical protein n=1 Tax=Gemmiger formicilis TaxID=745368 RepID=UPI0019565EEF|nr:hypothetical protein [Gemmiger formicilis]MBM6914980.1 hypothetical protein [Gemmiger formicilis]